MSTVERTSAVDRRPAEAAESSGDGGRREPKVPALAADAPAAGRLPAEPRAESLEHWYFCGDGSATRQP